jgi:hypothetical protein
MTNKLILAAVIAAVTGGVAATSAQAAPFKTPLTEKAASNVEAVHYNEYRKRPWWWKSNRYDNHYNWRKHPWLKHKYKNHRDWSRRDDHRDRDYRRW